MIPQSVGASSVSDTSMTTLRWSLISNFFSMSQKPCHVINIHAMIISLVVVR